MSGNGVVEELQGQDQGVGGDAVTAGTGGQPSTGVAEQPTNPVSGAAIAEAGAGAGVVAPQQAAGQQQQPVDLTQSPEFRKWQAARDRAEARLRGQMAEAAEANRRMQQQVEELRLQDADPEQVAAYYRNRATEMQAEGAQREEQWRTRLAIQEQATELLGKLGIAPDNPGLMWSEDPTWEGYAMLAESAAQVLGLKAQVVQSQGATETAAAAEAARVEALRAAGVTAVGAPTGGAPVAQNPIAEINDPDELLKMAMGRKRGGA